VQAKFEEERIKCSKDDLSICALSLSPNPLLASHSLIQNILDLKNVNLEHAWVAGGSRFYHCYVVLRPRWLSPCLANQEVARLPPAKVYIDKDLSQLQVEELKLVKLQVEVAKECKWVVIHNLQVVICGSPLLGDHAPGKRNDGHVRYGGCNHHFYCMLELQQLHFVLPEYLSVCAF
jgi:hypothetical protein